MEYWNPNVGVCGISELVGNALIMEGEKVRDQDLRFEELAGAGQGEEPGTNEEGE
jgi:hypothetical protein